MLKKWWKEGPEKAQKRLTGWLTPKGVRCLLNESKLIVLQVLLMSTAFVYCNLIKRIGSATEKRSHQSVEHLSYCQLRIEL